VKLWSFEKNVLGVATKYKDAMINYMKLEQAKDTTKFPLWENSCKTVYSFAISAVDKSSDSVLKVNKAIITNE
jgi:hypothetical protein